MAISFIYSLQQWGNTAPGLLLRLSACWYKEGDEFWAWIL